MVGVRDAVRVHLLVFDFMFEGDFLFLLFDRIVLFDFDFA